MFVSTLARRLVAAAAAGMSNAEALDWSTLGMRLSSEQRFPKFILCTPVKILHKFYALLPEQVYTGLT